MQNKFECVLFESSQIRSIFWLAAAVASGRSSAAMMKANRSGEVIDIDYSKITDNRFFAVLALVAVEHSLQFDRTKTWTKNMLMESLDAAFAAVVSQSDPS